MVNVTDVEFYKILAPSIVNTFIENQSLKGKGVILFATSGGNSIRNSVSVLKKAYSEIHCHTP